MTDTSDDDAATTGADSGERTAADAEEQADVEVDARADEARADEARADEAEVDDAGGLSPARFVLSMVVSVVVTFALVGAMAWGVWSLLPSPFGLAGAVLLLGGALLGNALVVRKNYGRWQRAQSGGGSA